ncbi:MAG: thiamine diphosphokinase [Synergistaceae bacterium]|nr:thiamine diphosphokinase [Synergistota bacterium]NLM70602.1 thiamine diphosphokinase [Synergistaceae bacterium]
MFSLGLPRIEALFDVDLPEPILLVAGGRKPDADWLAEASSGFRVRWSADSGVLACMEAGFLPQRLVGDADSTPEDVWTHAVLSGVSVTKHPEDKGLTDLQLALLAASEESAGTPVLVTGCWGGRFDHLFSNVFSVLWALERGTRVVALADEVELMLILTGGESALIRFTDEVPDVFSLLPLTSECSGVSLKNTRWELEDSLLLQKHPYSISNRTEEKEVPVRLQKGILGVYCGWFR